MKKIWCCDDRLNPPECFGEPVVTTLVRFFVCVRGCGCNEHLAFPAPSIFGQTIPAQSGRDPRRGKRTREKSGRVISPSHHRARTRASNIPETSVIEPKCRGIVDIPH